MKNELSSRRSRRSRKKKKPLLLKLILVLLLTGGFPAHPAAGNLGSEKLRDATGLSIEIDLKPDRTIIITQSLKHERFDPKHQILITP